MIDRSWPMDFARALGEPRLQGTLRGRNEDFEVSERLGFAPAGHGEHVYLRIRKTGANTAWIAKRIAAHAGVRTNDVGYAGKKDRHAVTEQWFSCWLAGRMAPDWMRLNDDELQVLETRRHTKKLRRGTHEANVFQLRIRDLRGDSPKEEVASRMTAIIRDGFPNYFGEQRFGHDGNNLRYAQTLFDGGDVPRGKRDLYISAVRGYVFNMDLSRRVDNGTWRNDEFGWLPGLMRTGNALPEDPAFADWNEGMKQLGVKAMRRPLAVVPQALEYLFESDDLILSFELPVGTYATSLLRELVAYDNAAAPGQAQKQQDQKQNHGVAALG